MNSHFKQWIVASILVTAAASASALAPGMMDTFEDGSTNGWASGIAHPTPPVNIADGGPGAVGGVGDRFLLLTSSGGLFLAGGKLVAFSGPQWAGNYIGAGVTAIGMDVNNLGGNDLNLRLGFSSFVVSANPLQVPAHSGWTHLSFPVDPAALTGSAVDALLSVTQFRLYHSSNAGSATEIAAQLGVDNITAVPEPAAVWLMLSGLAAIGTLVRRRRPA